MYFIPRALACLERLPYPPEAILKGSLAGCLPKAVSKDLAVRSAGAYCSLE
ncbi:MAG: hypothetical protein RI973_2233, partial [Bacteroidota bacterium]